MHTAARQLAAGPRSCATQMRAHAQAQAHADHVQDTTPCVNLGRTLQVMGAKAELREAVAWAGADLSFDIDKRVHVFELTIRALGGLLSAHALLEADPTLVPGESPKVVCVHLSSPAVCSMACCRRMRCCRRIHPGAR